MHRRRRPPHRRPVTRSPRWPWPWPRQQRSRCCRRTPSHRRRRTSSTTTSPEPSRGGRARPGVWARRIPASAPCAFGDPAGSKTIVLVGDSHAQRWELVIEVTANPGSQPKPSTTSKSKPLCEVERLLKEFVDSMESDSPVRLLAGVTANHSQDLAAPSAPIDHEKRPLLRLYLRLNPTPLQPWASQRPPSAGKVVVIGQIPNLQDGTAACLARHASDVQLCSSPASQAIQTGYISAMKQAAWERVGDKWPLFTPHPAPPRGSVDPQDGHALVPCPHNAFLQFLSRARALPDASQRLTHSRATPDSLPMFAPRGVSRALTEGTSGLDGRRSR